jgi:iron complex transport system substrate-binding protein
LRALAGLLALAACAPETAGGGIVSVNPCADAMLVRLVAPDRIAAISHYSQDPAATSIPLAEAKRFRATAGTAEEVIALRPGLVLASTFTPAATRDAYARAGLRVLLLDSPVTVAGSVAQVREVAAAVGEQARGEALVQEIADSLKHPPRRRRGSSFGPAHWEGQPSPTQTVATGPRPSPGKIGEPAALLLLSGDLANGSGTLLDELMLHAGLRNAAADYGLRYTGRVPLEVLAARPPAVVIAPDGGGRTAALRRQLLPMVPQASFPRALINCGGPAIPPALARLRAIRASL